MAVNNDFPKLPLNLQLAFRDAPPGWGGGSGRNSKAFVQIINRTIDGKTNNCGSFTCASGAATTTVNDPLCTENSVILCQALDADAAIELTMGTFYIVPGDRSFVVHHFNGAIADRKFNYIVVG